MLLAIDCGNTNTVFSIWDGERFIGTWRTSTEWQRTADQYYVWLSTLMKFQDIDVEITDMIISSTVPRVVFNLRVLHRSAKFLIVTHHWSSRSRLMRPSSM